MYPEDDLKRGKLCVKCKMIKHYRKVKTKYYVIVIVECNNS